jgi:cation diffusion facilitator CzcD-associated flavoprotein CzcO
MAEASKMIVADVDVVMVGAGISGINAAYRVQTQLPHLSYTILEARDTIGGTWDLFKYPGIRSDSDLHSFGFQWRPWTDPRAIADGPSIVKYLKECAAETGIDKKIQYRHKLLSADWNSDFQRWFLTVDANGSKQQINTRFLFFTTGYYNYSTPLPAIIPGIENFAGKTIHPQFWDQKLDYMDKKIVIIGSGATAITLLPVLAQTAAHVTMLQRSPSYILSQPSVDNLGHLIKKILPTWLALKIVRLRWLTLPYAFYLFCQTFPRAARFVMKKATQAQLPKEAKINYDRDWQPTYGPWDQRLCLCPDGDFYKPLREGKADVVTGHIEKVTADSIILKDGTVLNPDIIVTATGLKLQLAGGAQILLNGEPLNMHEKYLWKGLMLSDVPNAAFAIGYTNASWTLGADAAAQFVCRIIKAAEKKSKRPKGQAKKGEGIGVIVPRVTDTTGFANAPPFDLSSTYLVAARQELPLAGNKGPWRARGAYWRDWFDSRWGSLNGLIFEESK